MGPVCSENIWLLQETDQQLGCGMFQIVGNWHNNPAAGNRWPGHEQPVNSKFLLYVKIADNLEKEENHLSLSRDQGDARQILSGLEIVTTFFVTGVCFDSTLLT